MTRYAFIGGGNITQSRHFPLAKKMGLSLGPVIGPKIRPQFRNHNLVIEKLLEEDSSLTEAEWDSFDAAIVGVPPHHHFRVVEVLLKRQKHVLVEKPFTVSLEESKVLSNLAVKQGVHLAVMHNFQFASGWKKLTSALVEDGSKILSVECIQNSTLARRVPGWAQELRGGLFTDESAHFFYLLRSIGLVPRILSAAKWGDSNNDVSGCFFVAFESSMTPIVMKLNFSSAFSEWGVLVHTEKFVHSYDLFRDTYISIPHDGEHRGKQVLKTSATFILGHLRGYILNGPAYLMGRLHYGMDNVFESFDSAISGSEVLNEHISPQAGTWVVENIQRSLEAFDR